MSNVPSEILIHEKETAKNFVSSGLKIIQIIQENDMSGIHMLTLSFLFNSYSTSKDAQYRDRLHKLHLPKYKDTNRITSEGVTIAAIKKRIASIINWNRFSVEDILEISQKDEDIISGIISYRLLKQKEAIFEIANAMKSIPIWIFVMIISRADKTDNLPDLTIEDIDNITNLLQKFLDDSFEETAQEVIAMADNENKCIATEAISQLKRKGPITVTEIIDLRAEPKNTDGSKENH